MKPIMKTVSGILTMLLIAAAINGCGDSPSASQKVPPLNKQSVSIPVSVFDQNGNPLPNVTIAGTGNLIDGEGEPFHLFVSESGHALFYAPATSNNIVTFTATKMGFNDGTVEVNASTPGNYPVIITMTSVSSAPAASSAVAAAAQSREEVPTTLVFTEACGGIPELDPIPNVEVFTNVPPVSYGTTDANGEIILSVEDEVLVTFNYFLTVGSSQRYIDAQFDGNSTWYVEGTVDVTGGSDQTHTFTLTSDNCPLPPTGTSNN